MIQRKASAVLLCCALAMASAALGYGQNQTPPSPTPRSGYDKSTDKATSAAKDPFLSQAIEINTAEVQLGQLAQKKTQNARVKSFGAMMAKDHSAALAKLQKLQPGKATLSSEHQQLKTKLSGMSGAQFDKEYIDAMVDGHRAAVSLFEKQVGSGTSNPNPSTANVNDAARELLPTIKHHLDEAEQIQKSLAQPAK